MLGEALVRSGIRRISVTSSMLIPADSSVKGLHSNASNLTQTYHGRLKPDHLR